MAERRRREEERVAERTAAETRWTAERTAMETELAAARLALDATLARSVASTASRRRLRTLRVASSAWRRVVSVARESASRAAGVVAARRLAASRAAVRRSFRLWRDDASDAVASRLAATSAARASLDDAARRETTLRRRLASANRLHARLVRRRARTVLAAWRVDAARAAAKTIATRFVLSRVARAP